MDRLNNVLSSSIKDVAKNSKSIDFLIIGSGTAGVTAACELAKSGFKVVILEKGPLLLMEHIGSTSFGSSENFAKNIQASVSSPTSWVSDEQIEKNEIPDNNSSWSVVGGRTIFWGGCCPRFIPEEVHDWPLSYEELAHYYHRAEEVMYTSGRHQPAFIENETVTNIQAELAENGIPSMCAPLCVDTHAVREGYISKGFDSSAARMFRNPHFQNFCDKPGISLVTQIEVTHLHYEGNNVDAVEVFSTADQQTYRLSPKHVVLACSPIESTRLVVNSGLQNDHIGHHINEHLFYRGLMKMRTPSDEAIYLFIPATKDRLFQYQIQGAFDEVWYDPGYATLWLDWHKGGTYLLFYCFGVASVQKDNRLIIPPGEQSKHYVRYEHSKSDLERLDEMQEYMKHVAESLDADIVRDEVEIPGRSLHEVGGLRFGKSADEGVCDEKGFFWQVQNLSVADASSWRSQGAANTYLSITAMSLWHADNLIKAYGRS